MDVVFLSVWKKIVCNFEDSVFIECFTKDFKVPKSVTSNTSKVNDAKIVLFHAFIADIIGHYFR